MPLIPPPSVEFLTTAPALEVGPIAVGTIPISIFAAQLVGFTFTVEVTCNLLGQTYAQWQSDTYDLIVAAYDAKLQAYKDERAGLTIQQSNPVDASSPDQNARTINQELKRQIVWMLLTTPNVQFGGRPAISWDPTGQNPPSITPSAALSAAPEIH